MTLLTSYYQRGLSDHVPLMLQIDEVNWGPRPLRMLKCWFEFPGYGDFVRDKWGSLQCQGWGGYVLKEKLKMLKLSLKEWHMQHARNIGGKIMAVKNQISVLDSKAELSMLLDEEVLELHDLSANLHSLARVQNSINLQNSRLSWLKDGDANSKNFHGVMSCRRHHNSINMVSVDGLMVEGVHNVRSAVFHHFSNHFKSLGVVRPNIGGLQFRKLSGANAGALTKPFSQEEVK